MKKEEVIPFYGSTEQELFEIERRCMDRSGKVLEYLNKNLPLGKILDIGAGNGFTASRLNDENRTLYAMEPSDGMKDLDQDLIWSKGVAQDIPFHSNYFDGIYSTWAYFLCGDPREDTGVTEALRVLKPGGKFIIINNYGEDEFCSYMNDDITAKPSYYQEKGFNLHIIKSAFEFDSKEEAQKLMTYFFGIKCKDLLYLKYEYNISTYILEKL